MKPEITFFCGGKDVPASRFRVEPVANFLSAHGWPVETIYGYGRFDHKLGNGVLRRAYRASCRVSRYTKTAFYSPNGPVMVQRLAWPWGSGAEKNLASKTNGFVFDFDDAVFLGGNGKVSDSRSRALKKIFRASDIVIAGNSWLAEYAADSAEVKIIPTCIDTTKYIPAESGLKDFPIIGWIGTSGNFQYLKQLIRPLKCLRDEGVKFKFIICSDAKDLQLFKSLHAEFIKWNAFDELSVLQGFDVGIMPLFKNNWCKGKCSFKLIQYKAVGIPSVGSSVGFNNDVILNGVTGFLVDEHGWYDSLKTLLLDESLRDKMGKNARLVAEKNYDISVSGAMYQRIFEKFI